MLSSEIRSSFLEFFEKRGHIIKKSSSLVSKDPTVLLTTAGMQQFIPYFLGDKRSQEKRYASIQKCFRTPDIDEVGDESHLTFFEMLGNFSIGDYFKEEAITWAWEYLTGVLKLESNNLYATIFAGENEVARDTESEGIWLKLGLPKQQIYGFGKKDNFWGPPGESGPCGPSSEIHYDRGNKYSCRNDKHACGPNCECGRFVEIWNLVFMQYFCAEDGVLTALPDKNIDTGAGLERLAMFTQDKDNIFDTDLLAPLIKTISDITNTSYQKHTKDYRIIADHLRGAVFLISDGVIPGKNGRDYVLRRVIRRAKRRALNLKRSERLLLDLVPVVIEKYGPIYPELINRREHILQVLEMEEKKFSKTLNKGLKMFDREVKDNKLGGKTAFDLFQTYGFPLEVIRELAQERGVDFDESGYNRALKEHQELSRIGARSKFERRGGGQGEEVEKAHTATHLLQAALRNLLGPGVKQAGSRLSNDELSFDFTYDKKLTEEQKNLIEQEVNNKIMAALPVKLQEMPLDKAKRLGALGLFEEKYGERVQVCSVLEGDKTYSKELCGGPHVTNTELIKKFKIIKEKSSSAGVRRIKAVVGDKAAEIKE